MNAEKQSFNFKENHHGILNHDGWVKVAKSNITAKILSINKDKIQVKGNKGAYVCDVHKNLLDDLFYMNSGDTVSVKWRNGTPFIVGYCKKEIITNENTTTDQPIVEDKFVKFFPKREVKS